MRIILFSKSHEETVNLGKKIAKFLFPGAVLTLTGDLGAGKTTFTNGIAQGLGIEEKVSSPTFNILKCYFKSTLPLYHIDAYRLEDGTNKNLGLEEFIEGNGVCVIEWPQFIKEIVNFKQSLNFEITYCNNGRNIFISTENDRYLPLFDFLKERDHV